MYPYLGRIAQQHLAELRADAEHRRLVRAIRAHDKRVSPPRRRVWWTLRRKVQSVAAREQLDARPTSNALRA
jgi:hypothetical protein